MGIVSTLNGGGQNVNGGTGITTVMFDGEQTVDNEGVAILITMNGGSQSIGGRDGYGMGIVSTMSGGLQRISYSVISVSRERSPTANIIPAVISTSP